MKLTDYGYWFGKGGAELKHSKSCPGSGIIDRHHFGAGTDYFHNGQRYKNISTEYDGYIIRRYGSNSSSIDIGVYKTFIFICFYYVQNRVLEKRIYENGGTFFYHGYSQISKEKFLKLRKNFLSSCTFFN